MQGQVFDGKQKIALQSSRSDCLIQDKKQNESNRYECTKRAFFNVQEAVIIFVCQVYFALFTFGHGYDVKNRFITCLILFYIYILK